MRDVQPKGYAELEQAADARRQWQRDLQRRLSSGELTPAEAKALIAAKAGDK